VLQLPWLSNIGSKVVPLFVVFQTPEEANAKYIVPGFFVSTAKSAIRPEVVAGPTLRNLNALRLVFAQSGWSSLLLRWACAGSVNRIAKRTTTAEVVRRNEWLIRKSI
jgi:hypothetical protein